MHDWLDVFPIVSAGDAALVEAIDGVAEHHLSFWDAMLWTTARQRGCSAIISENMQDGRRLGGVEFINPFAPDSKERLAPLFGS